VQKAAENLAVTARLGVPPSRKEKRLLAALRRETGAIWWRIKTRVRGKVSLCRPSPKPFALGKRWRKLHSGLFEGSIGVTRSDFPTALAIPSSPSNSLARRRELVSNAPTWNDQGDFVPDKLLKHLQQMRNTAPNLNLGGPDQRGVCPGQ
jgi:hypothetical protein